MEDRKKFVQDENFPSITFLRVNQLLFDLKSFVFYTEFVLAPTARSKHLQQETSWDQLQMKQLVYPHNFVMKMSNLHVMWYQIWQTFACSTSNTADYFFERDKASEVIVDSWIVVHFMFFRPMIQIFFQSF